MYLALELGKYPQLSFLRCPVPILQWIILLFKPFPNPTKSSTLFELNIFASRKNAPLVVRGSTGSRTSLSSLLCPSLMHISFGHILVWCFYMWCHDSSTVVPPCPFEVGTSSRAWLPQHVCSKDSFHCPHPVSRITAAPCSIEVLADSGDSSYPSESHTHICFLVVYPPGTLIVTVASLVDLAPFPSPEGHLSVSAPCSCEVLAWCGTAFCFLCVRFSYVGQGTLTEVLATPERLRPIHSLPTPVGTKLGIPEHVCTNQSSPEQSFPEVSPKLAILEVCANQSISEQVNLKLAILEQVASKQLIPEQVSPRLAIPK